MVGYPEALSDPSYRGQILVLTYPLIGNYGVPSEDVVDAHGLPRYFESAGVHISALVVAHYSAFHSHWTSTRSLGEWLARTASRRSTRVDTRAHAPAARERRATLGTIAAMGSPTPPLHEPNTTNLVAQVSTKQTRVFGEGLTPRILAFDCGIKYNIIRYLVEPWRVQLTLVPFDYDLERNPENIQCVRGTREGTESGGCGDEGARRDVGESARAHARARNSLARAPPSRDAVQRHPLLREPAAA